MCDTEEQTLRDCYKRDIHKIRKSLEDIGLSHCITDIFDDSGQYNRIGCIFTVNDVDKLANLASKIVLP